MPLTLNLHQKLQKRQWHGPIYLLRSINVLFNEESKEAFEIYNLEALQKFQNRNLQEALCCLDETFPTPGAKP